MSCEIHVDLHLVIDGTGSMARAVDRTKALAGSLHGAVMARLQADQKHLGKLRVAVTAFRGIACDGKSALVSSGFLERPEQEEQLRRSIARFTPTGGDVRPGNSLVALAFALTSDWTDKGAFQRHVTILFAAAPPHPFSRVTGAGYPDGLAASMDELREIWRGCNQSTRFRNETRRLYLIVPTNEAEYLRWQDEDWVALLPIDDALQSVETARDCIASTLVGRV